MIPWILIMVLVGLIVVGLLIAMLVFYRNKKMPPTDYYTMFILGICWLPLGIIGIATDNPGFNAFFIMGLVFMGIGLAHKKEWKKNHRTWKQLSKAEQKMKMWVMIILGVLLLLGLLAFLAVRLA
jgi:hypothetical protein